MFFIVQIFSLCVITAIAESDFFIPLKLPRKSSKLGPKGDLKAGFRYNTLENFSNNSIYNILADFPDDTRRISERCMMQLIHGKYQELDDNRRAELSSFLPLQRLCPPLKGSKSYAPLSGHVVVVFAILIYSDPSASLATAERILSTYEMSMWSPRFVFHVDSSSPLSLWEHIYDWTLTRQDEAIVIPRNESVDVEWGAISTNEANIKCFTAGKQTWPNIATFATLSESHVGVASAHEMGLFFRRYKGLNWPGGHGAMVDPKDRTWKFQLNNVAFSCDRQVMHIGWREYPIDTTDGYYRGVLMTAFWSTEFMNWAIESADGLASMTAVAERIQYAPCSDELLWGTLFYNSPYCHHLAELNKHNGFGEEFGSHTWSHDCDDMNNVNKELCRSMTHRGLPWWFGVSPQWIVPGDVPLLLSRRPMFARKLKKDQNFDEIINLLDTPDSREDNEPFEADNVFYLTTGEDGSKDQQCVKILKPDGSIGWVPCSSRGAPPAADMPSDDDDDDDDKEIGGSEPTPFVLSECIGNFTYGDEFRLPGSSRRLAESCAADQQADDSVCTDSNRSRDQSVTSRPPIVSHVLPSGYMFGHCMIRSVDLSPRIAKLKFCLSPILISYFGEDYNKWSHVYADLGGQNRIGNSIGFLPCKQRYSVEATQQLFIFYNNSEIAVGSRESKVLTKSAARITTSSGGLKRIRFDSQRDDSKCAVRGSDNKLSLQSCISSNPRNILRLKLAN
jgi:hypothetical protein